MNSPYHRAKIEREQLIISLLTQILEILKKSQIINPVISDYPSSVESNKKFEVLKEKEPEVSEEDLILDGDIMSDYE